MTDRASDDDIKKLVAMQMYIGDCGCGEPHRYWRVLKQALEAVRDREGNESTYEAIARKCDPVDLAYFLMTIIDEQWNLTTHGGSIHWAWIEKGGEEVIRLIEKYGDDRDEWVDWNNDKEVEAHQSAMRDWPEIWKQHFDWCGHCPKGHSK